MVGRVGRLQGEDRLGVGQWGHRQGLEVRRRGFRKFSFENRISRECQPLQIANFAFEKFGFRKTCEVKHT